MSIKVKVLTSVFVFIISLFCFELTSAEESIDEYVDSCKQYANGTLDPSIDIEQDELLHNLPMSIVCSQPEILSRLEDYERDKIQALKKRIEEAKKHYSQEELNNIEEISQYILINWEEEIGKSRMYTGEELSSLDIKLRSLWSEMLAALKAKDVDRAVKYYSRETRETYRESFTTLRDNLPKIAEDLSDIQLIKMSSPYEVEYDIRSVENGVTYSYMLIFVKDIDGEWWIQKY